MKNRDDIDGTRSVTAADSHDGNNRYLPSSEEPEELSARIFNAFRVIDEPPSENCDVKAQPLSSDKFYNPFKSQIHDLSTISSNIIQKVELREAV